VEQTAGGFRVRANGDWLEAEHVVLATPAYDARAIVSAACNPNFPACSRAFPTRRPSRWRSAIAKATFDHPLNGHGFLVPKKERKLHFRLHLGGQQIRLSRAGRTWWCCDVSWAPMPCRSDEALVDAARAELRSIMNLEAEPVFHNIARWPRSMAQYTVGHEKRVARIEELARAIPGLYLAGNAYHGIGIPDCVRMGQEAATKIISINRPYINPKPQPA
jgi:oxygen-dependent protoporphyrinogen oxidase